MIGWLIFGGIVLLIAILLALSATVVIDIENNITVEIKYFLFKILVFPESDAKKKKRAEKEKKKAAKDKKRQEKLKKKQDKQKKKQSKKQKDKPVKTDTAAEKAAKPNKKTESHRTVKQAESHAKTENKPDEKTDVKTDGNTGEKSDGKSEEKPKAKIDFETIKGMIDSASPPIKRLLRKIRVNDVYIDIVAGGEDSAKTALTYGTLYAVICPIIEWLKSVITFKVEELNIEADFEKEKTDYFVHAKAKLRLSTALGCAIWLLFRFIRNSAKAQTANTTQSKTGGNKNGTAS